MVNPGAWWCRCLLLNEAGAGLQMSAALWFRNRCSWFAASVASCCIIVLWYLKDLLSPQKTFWSELLEELVYDFLKISSAKGRLSEREQQWLVESWHQLCWVGFHISCWLVIEVQIPCLTTDCCERHKYLLQSICLMMIVFVTDCYVYITVTGWFFYGLSEGNSVLLCTGSSSLNYFNGISHCTSKRSLLIQCILSCGYKLSLKWPTELIYFEK